MIDETTLKIILAVLTVAMGTALGVLSGGFLAYVRQRNDIAKRLLDEYFKVRDELSDVLSDIANERVGEPIEEDLVREIRARLSKLSYQFFDFLPADVLKEIYCLHACLSDTEHRIYRCSESQILPLREEGYADFVTEVSIVDNFKFFAMIPLTSPDDAIRKSACMNCQARKVVRTMNDHLTNANMMSWARQLRKRH